MSLFMQSPRIIASRLFFVCLAGLLAASSAVAQDSPVIKINGEAERSEITIVPLRGGVHLLEGSGGNIGAFADENTQFLVDAGISVSRDKLARALAGLSSGRITHVVNTHWHWDHTDGNPWLPGRGIVVVAHPRTAHYLANTERVEDWNYTFAPLAAGGQPTVLVGGRKKFKVGGETIDVVALPPSHTDGDLYIYFRKADVLFLGDTYWNGVYPFIDNTHGGSIDGMLKAVDVGLEVAGPDTLIVPGHGSVSTRKELAEFRRVLQTIRDRVHSLKTQGMDEQAAIAAKPTAEFDEKWGQFVINPDFFVHLVYAGL